MTNRESSFENTVEDIEKQYGIIDPNKQKKLGTEIIVDEYGRFWRYNETGTIKWRVKIDGSPYHNKLEEEIQRSKRVDAYIATIKDPGVKGLLEEEELYNQVGGTAAQWQELERRKKEYEQKHNKKITFSFR